jgi:hypothetical protein
MDLVRLFFGPDMSDTRGEVFFNLAYNGTQYDKAINADNVNSILAEPLLQVMLAKNYQGGTGDVVDGAFLEFMQDVGTYHKQLDDGAAIGTDATKSNLLINVYKNPSVPANVRKFFETHLKVLNIATSLPTTNYADTALIRFNLVKVSSASADKPNKLFESTIPLLPAGKGSATDALRRNYADAAAGAARTTAKSFNLEIKTLIKNVILARDATIPPSASAAEPLEDLYESVVTGVRYVRDSAGVLRVVGADGKPDMSKDFEGAELEDALKKAGLNCASTGINLPDCEFVYKCLLSGKPETLSECLDRLRDADMFKVARKEVATMNPKVAVQLLRTFGFKPRREAGSNVVLPPTFDEWSVRLSRTVDEATAGAIRGNKKLMEYLRAVVDIVRSNPAIINKDLKNGVVSDFARKTGLSVFRNPFPERKVTDAIIDGVLFAPQALARSMQLPLSLQIANISGRVRMPMMMGGGSSAECPNASNIKQAFNMIYAEMEKNGKVLVDSDKSRINATIEKLDKLESTLMRLMDDTKLFAKLNAALNPGQSVSTENVTLDDITNVRNENITGETLGNLNDCIVKNLRDQTQLSSDLVNRVQMPLLQLLLKGGSNALSPVN